MQVQLNEEELQKKMEVEAYEKIRAEEIEEKKINDKAKRVKADKTFRLIAFGIIFLVIVAVVVQYLFAG